MFQRLSEELSLFFLVVKPPQSLRQVNNFNTDPIIFGIDQPLVQYKYWVIVVYRSLQDSWASGLKSSNFGELRFTI